MNTTTLKQLFTYYSTYVAFFSASAAAYWLQLDRATQDSILAMWPSLKFIGPAVGFVSFLVARGLPQAPKSTTPPQ
jgi:hypothetical protein